MTCNARAWFFLMLLAAGFASPSRAQEAYQQDPINYATASVNDPIARLQQRLDRGESKLTFDPQHGYLASVLRELKIRVSSQSLVFSKTSFQRDRISPDRPRALYFDDDTYVGWVRGGDVIELASTDPNLGTVFYTLEQPGADTASKPQPPRFLRQTASCLQCHGSSMTRDIPGLIVRSVYPDSTGQPVLSAGTFMTTQESPLAERWGGWYVTGTHGRQRHMGNVVVGKQDGPAVPATPAATPAGLLDLDSGANLCDLSGKFDTSAYLRGDSDVVTLMVFAHQAQTHNLLTRANYQARLALRDEAAMDASLGRSPSAGHSETTLARIRDAGEPLVKHMLFCDEAPLGKLQGAGDFDKDFESRGPRDSQGRSLRELDLKRRVFRYPLSYLVYSAQFDALPAPVKDYVYRRFWEVLSGADQGDAFSHLSSTTRKAIVEILRETKPGLPDYFNK